MISSLSINNLSHTIIDPPDLEAKKEALEEDKPTAPAPSRLTKSAVRRILSQPDSDSDQYDSDLDDTAGMFQCIVVCLAGGVSSQVGSPGRLGLHHTRPSKTHQVCSAEDTQSTRLRFRPV